MQNQVESKQYHESIPEGIDLNTIISELNKLVVLYEVNGYIKISPNISILHIVKKLLNKKRQILEFFKNEDSFDIEISSFEVSEEEFFKYLKVYLKTRDNIDEKEIDKLENAYNSYLNTITKEVFRGKIDYILSSKDRNSISRENLLLLQEYITKPSDLEKVLGYLKIYPKHTKQVVNFIGKIGINDFLDLQKVLGEQYLGEIFEGGFEEDIYLMFKRDGINIENLTFVFKEVGKENMLAMISSIGRLNISILSKSILSIKPNFLFTSISKKVGGELMGDLLIKGGDSIIDFISLLDYNKSNIGEIVSYLIKSYGIGIITLIEELKPNIFAGFLSELDITKKDIEKLAEVLRYYTLEGIKDKLQKYGVSDCARIFSKKGRFPKKIMKRVF